MKIEDLKVGQTITFTASRILKGNPVVGQITHIDETWCEVLLHKDVEGAVTSWAKGDKKSFRKTFMHQLQSL